MEYQAQIIDSFIQAFSKFANESFYLSGITNVFEQPEFNNVNNIKRFIDMMERREIVKLIGTKDGLPSDSHLIRILSFKPNDNRFRTIFN